MPAPTRKHAGPTIAARRTGASPRDAMKPTTAKPRLASPTSVWNGLSAQPMKRAVEAPKNTCITKL